MKLLFLQLRFFAVLPLVLNYSSLIQKLYQKQ